MAWWAPIAVKGRSFLRIARRHFDYSVYISTSRMILFELASIITAPLPYFMLSWITLIRFRRKGQSSQTK